MAVLAVWCALLALTPPVPPRRAVDVVYGHEPGVFKGTSADALLRPARVLTDELWHLRNKDDADNLAHVEAENAYAAGMLQESPGWQESRDEVHKHLIAQTTTSDTLLWHWCAGNGEWEYAKRHDEALGPYPQYLRRRVGTDEAGEVLLDANAAPALLPSEFDPSMSFMGVVRGVSAFVPSPSGDLAAYTVDTTGEEKFSLMVVALPIGPSSVPLASVADVDVDVAWGRDDSELFYASMDATGRPCRLHRLRLDADPSSTASLGKAAEGDTTTRGFGASGVKKATKSSKKGGAKRSGSSKRSSSTSKEAGSEVVFEERDARFRMSFRRAAEGSRLMLELNSRDASEVWALPWVGGGAVQNEPWETGAATGGAWHCLGQRASGLTYSGDYDGGGSGGSEARYVIITNDGGAAVEGAMRVLSEVDARSGLGRASWRPVEAMADGADVERTLESVQCFSGVAAIEGRHNGASAVYLWRYSDDSVLLADGESLHAVDGAGGAIADVAALTDEGQWSVRLCPADEQRYADGAIRLEHSAPTIPPQVLEVALPSGVATGLTGAVRVLWAQPLPAGFAPSEYVSGRVWATADDGIQIPISLLWRVDGDANDAGARAALLNGYGAYGFCTDPAWDVDRMAVASCGLVHAICHVRGGGELGRAWHAAGRREHKATSFSDMLACARRLVDAGIARADGLAIEGRSAGGLLVGATLNLAPSTFCVALASVPFLDPAGTLQDATQPLTVNEWDEFGNPNEQGAHDDVLGFSPLHNVQTDEAYPPCLLLPALNDARTGWWEAHKFAHAVRTRSSDAADADANPVLVSTDMEGGHFRPADPTERARGRAYELGFVLAAVRGTL